MKTSEKTNELLTALAAVQSRGIMVEKDRENPHLHNRYASLAAVWTALRPVLSAHGLVLIQTTESGTDGPTVLTRLVHVASGQWIETALSAATGAEKGTSTVQKVGSVVSYCRRYSICTLLSVIVVDDAEDDDGACASKRTEPGWSTAQRTCEGLINGIAACGTLDALRSWWVEHQDEIGALPEDLHDQITATKNARKTVLAAGPRPATSKPQPAEGRIVPTPPAIVGTGGATTAASVHATPTKAPEFDEFK